MADSLTAGPAYLVRPGNPVTEFVIFLSSSSELAEQRDLFENMVREVETQFRAVSAFPDEWQFALKVDRWESTAPQKASAEGINADFVARAIRANLTVVFLSSSLKRGTREELEGVLSSPPTQLAVIWMRPASGASRVRTFLRRHSSDFLYLETSAPDTAGPILAMVRVIARLLAEITSPSGRRLFVETR